MNHEKLLSQGYRQYQGDDIHVYFNLEICQHSSECAKGDPKVFSLGKKPWINPDQASITEVKRIVAKCPSGALKCLET